LTVSRNKTPRAGASSKLQMKMRKHDMPEATRKITPEDLLPIAEYDARRKALKQDLLPIKKLRRIEVGPFATFYFENYATMWMQVQEMLRIEKGGAGQIEGELAAYNPLIPQGAELIATLMLEIEDEKRRNATLLTLGGIEESVFLEIGGETIRATPTEYDDRTTADGKTSSVHWLRFSLTPELIAKFAAAKVVLGLDHRNYGHMAVLGDEARAVLAKDFV
jgi:uncharacterized protein DUF3501